MAIASRRRMLLRAVPYLTTVMLLAYVGSFYYFRSAGLVSARKHNVPSMYYLADPDNPNFVSVHYARARFYFPLIYLNDRHLSDEKLCYP